MRDLKYIIVRLRGDEHLTAILFNGTIPHSMMVPEGYYATSGGFCQVFVDGPEIVVSSWGKATSLKVNSLKSDSEIIKNTLNRTLLFI